MSIAARLRRSLNRKFSLLCLAGCLLLTLGPASSAHSQESGSQAPDSPSDVRPVEPPDPPAPVFKPGSHVRRHKMRDPRERERKREIDALEQQIDRLKAEIGAEGAEQIEAEQLRMKAKLQRAYDRLEALELGEELERIDPFVDDEPFVPYDRPKKYVSVKTGRIAFLNHIYIEAGEQLDATAMAILGDIHVMGEVNNAVVSIGGDIYIKGTVTDEVIALFGNVYLGETAIVEGDIVAIDVFAEKGAIIDGSVHLVHLPYISFGGRGTELPITLLVALSILSGLAMLLGLLIQFVAPANVDRVEARLRGHSVWMFLGGILVQILTPIVFGFLVVTLIGIPVAFLVLPLVLMAALLLGIVAISRMLGEVLIRREGSPRRVALSFILGAVILITPLIVGISLKIPSDSGTIVGTTIVGLMGNIATFLGISLMYITSTAGLGAAVFSRLGFRDRKNKGDAPAPPASAAPVPPVDPLGPLK